MAKAKSQAARDLDDAIRAANARATHALYTGDQGALADANTDLEALRMMRLGLNELDETG